MATATLAAAKTVAVDLKTKQQQQQQQPSQPSPLGATVVDGGVNFSVFSRTASGIDLLLFDRVDDAKPSAVIPIDPVAGRAYHYWHVFVPRLKAGQIYGYRADGPFAPE